ncbi:hypothetical protein VTK26DRAFT_6479 [Humicola hyalothermophila]
MIVKDLKRLALVGVPLVILLMLGATFWRLHTDPTVLGSQVGALLKTPGPAAKPSSRPPPTANATHTELYSRTSDNGRYYEIRFGVSVYNPNIIPHPTLENTWFVVGQSWNEPRDVFDMKFEEVGCSAQLIGGVLLCIDFVRPLPYNPTTGDKCKGDLAHANLNVGPHDARVFWGPHQPYTIYGSNSQFTCFGQWVQDFRKLVGWDAPIPGSFDFQTDTELRRPPPIAALEKNYFLFWDAFDQAHVHYDMYPNRSYAKLVADKDRALTGQAGENLAAKAGEHDASCMRRYLPTHLPDSAESIHQATNSLKVTLCRRADKGCRPRADNTFIMTVIQHKRYYYFHSEYEPYVVLFNQIAPFELHAISKKPLWIHGRQRIDDEKTEMFYVTSMNWKKPGVNYHGYLDDELFLGFGIEDKWSGAMDVTPEDLLEGLGLCSDE